MSLFWCLALVNYHIFNVISSEPAILKRCISANAIRISTRMSRIWAFWHHLNWAWCKAFSFRPCLQLPQSKYTDRRSYIANLHHFHPPGAQFRYVANKLNGTFALMPRGWISRLIKIPQPFNLHNTYLFRYSRRWYAQTNIFKAEVSKK